MSEFRHYIILLHYDIYIARRLDNHMHSLLQLYNILPRVRANSPSLAIHLQVIADRYHHLPSRLCHLTRRGQNETLEILVKQSMTTTAAITDADVFSVPSSACLMVFTLLMLLMMLMI